MVETINAVCPSCKKTFVLPSKYENKKVKCKCGQVFIVAKKLAVHQEHILVESAQGKHSKNKSVIVLGVVLLLTLILSVFIVWFFIFRDKWENNNSLQIHQMSDLVISLIQSGKLEKGIAKYEELQTFVKNRQIKNLELHKELSNAQKAFGEAKFRLEEADKLVKLQTLESVARSFIENGDFQNGIAKYQEALDFIQKNETSNPKFTEAMGRILAAKRNATKLFEQVNRQREEEQKLEEEKQRLANMRATVNGGAWLTRKSGNSEPIRGLKIEVLQSQGKNKQLLAILQSSLEFEKLSLALNQELNKDRKTKSNLIESTQEHIESLQKEISTISKDSSADVNMLAIRVRYAMEDYSAELSKKNLEFDLKETQQDKWIAVNKAYMKIGITWEAICLQQTVSSTHTDIDGKYRIDLPVGSYYLYAVFESVYSRVDWFIPLQILSNKEIKVDFHNENAFRIDNKDSSP